MIIIQWESLERRCSITLVLPDGTKKEVEILSVIKENYYGLTDRVGADFVYYTSAEIFKEWVSPEFLMTYACDVEDDKEGEFNQFLKNYTETVEPLMNYESKEFWSGEYEGMIGLVILAGGLLTIVIAVIGILNFINSILTGIVTRQKEFAIMQAIGMTRKQLIRMLILEGMYYAVFTIGASFVIGCIFSLPILLILGAMVPWLAYSTIGIVRVTTAP